MPTIWFLNKQGSKVQAGHSAFDFGKLIKAGSISAENGLPNYVDSISLRYGIYSGGPRNRSVSYTTLDCTTLRTLLENTPRKLGKIHVGCGFFSEPARLSPEYLDYFTSICNKVECLELGLRALSHAAEIECLATALAQPSANGPIRELQFDLSSFDTPEKSLCLQQLFRSIAAASLTKLEIHNIPDLSESKNLGSVLIESLKTNRCIKILLLDGHLGLECHMLVEKLICAILEQSQVEDLRVFSRKSCYSDIENNIHNDMANTFFDKLSTAKNLKNLEVDHSILLESDSYRTAFENAISRNTCLERLHIWFRCGNTEKQTLSRRYNEKLCIPLSVNRAVRGLSQSTPLGLWPHVLERAGKILYYLVETKESEPPRLVVDQWQIPSSDRPRADVIYKLLRERVLVR